MKNSIILIILNGTSIFGAWKFEDSIFLSSVFAILFVILCILTVFHVIFLSVKIHEYKCLFVKRNTFAKTLKEARARKKDCELAAITKEILDFNIELARLKYSNTTWFLSQYIDDRIDSLEPIN